MDYHHAIPIKCRKMSIIESKWIGYNENSAFMNCLKGGRVREEAWWNEVCTKFVWPLFYICKFSSPKVELAIVVILCKNREAGELPTTQATQANQMCVFCREIKCFRDGAGFYSLQYFPKCLHLIDLVAVASSDKNQSKQNNNFDLCILNERTCVCLVQSAHSREKTR